MDENKELPDMERVIRSTPSLQLIFNDKEKINSFADFVSVINHLIDTDFNRLINLLYRIDVDEMVLKKSLARADLSITSGEIIARLILEREAKKIETRKKNKI